MIAIDIHIKVKQMSFLPEPDFNPKFPSRSTLASRALYMMLEGKKISHPDFEGSTSSWRLAAHIYNLNKLGWNVQTIEVDHYTENKPKSRRICLYFLSYEHLKKLKKIAGEVWHD
jgi:hypothetical protein